MQIAECVDDICIRRMHSLIRGAYLVIYLVSCKKVHWAIFRIGKEYCLYKTIDL